MNIELSPRDKLQLYDPLKDRSRLSRLDEILSLPIQLISSDKDILEMNILKKARKITDNLFSHEILPYEDLRTFLSRLEAFEMDSNLFSQLSFLYLETDKFGSAAESTFFLCTEEISSIFLSSMPNPSYKKIGKIQPANHEINNRLNHLRTTNKGWTLRIEEEKFLGLSLEGPRILSLVAWTKQIIDLLRYDCKRINKTKNYIFYYDPTYKHKQLEHIDKNAVGSLQQQLLSSLIEIELDQDRNIPDWIWRSCFDPDRDRTRSGSKYP